MFSQPQQWWGRYCSGSESPVLLQAPSAPPPCLLACPESIFVLCCSHCWTLLLTTLTCLKTAVWTIPPATIVPLSLATLKAISQLAFMNKQTYHRCLLHIDLLDWFVDMWGYILQAPPRLLSSRWTSVWCLLRLLQTCVMSQIMNHSQQEKKYFFPCCNVTVKTIKRSLFS